MISPAAGWWGSDSVTLAAFYQLTAGTYGGGSASVGTLPELYGAGGDFNGAPSYLVPAELPAEPLQFDLDGFALDGGYSNRKPDTQNLDETLVPHVFIWAENATLLEGMDSATAFVDQRIAVLVRVRRDENASLNAGGYGVTVAREFAQRQALNLCRGVSYLLIRDLPATARTLIADGFGVCYSVETEPPAFTPNFGADGDTYSDAIAIISVIQLRATPANSGV